MRQVRVPTLKDVAQRAGVHTGTASRALNREQSHLVNGVTRAKVEAAAKELGYRTNALAQSLRRGTTGAVGVVVANLDHLFVNALLRGIDRELNPRQFISLLSETHDDSETLQRVVTRLINHRVDALVITAALAPDEEFIAEVERQIPVVLAVRSFSERPSDEQGGSRRREVLQDDVLGSQIAVSHLIRQGHRRIAQIRGNPQNSSFAWRHLGYTRALSQSPGVLDVSTESHALEPSVPEGRRLAMELLRLPREQQPTAIFAHNDLLAVGTIDAIRLAGLRCPQDISVIGYDDSPLIDHLDPPLSTVRLPGFEMGRHCGQMILEVLDGKQPATNRIVLAPTFIERRSTQPPAESSGLL